MRAGELPSLKWSDVHDNYIHIHSQQLSNKRKGGKKYYYANWTKDEKGESKGGRKFPLTQVIRDLLDELIASYEASLSCGSDRRGIFIFSSLLALLQSHSFRNALFLNLVRGLTVIM